MDGIKRNQDTTKPSLEKDDINLEEEIDVEVKGPLAILWDMENCCIPNGVSPEEVAGNIRKSLHMRGIRGPVTTFSAYGDFSSRSRNLREGCQRSGINLIDVPNGRKDAADHAILVDMFLFALDNAPPSTILLISGDVDFAVALNKLGQRGYTILVAVVNLSRTCSVLCNAAKFVWVWPEMARSHGIGLTPGQILSKKKIKVMEANERSACGLWFELKAESNLISLVQPHNIGSGGCGKPAETTEPNPTLSMCPSNIGPGDYEMISETTTELNPSSLMHPCNIRLDDCWLLSETTTVSNPASLMQPSKIGSGDYGMPSERAEANQTSSIQPSNISLGDCGLPPAKKDPNPTLLIQPSKVNPGYCGLLYETTGLNPTSPMQPSNIRPGDCGLPSKTTGKLNQICLMHPRNVIPDAFGLPSQKTKLNQTSLMQPSNIRWGQVKNSLLRSQNNSNASKQNSIKGYQPRNIFKKTMEKHQRVRVRRSRSKAFKINEFKGSPSKQDQQNQHGRLQVGNQNEGQRSPNYEPKNKNGRKGPPSGCFICGGDHYARDCPKKNSGERGKHQIHT